jgi:hypothetical protein
VICQEAAVVQRFFVDFVEKVILIWTSFFPTNTRESQERGEKERV